MTQPSFTDILARAEQIAVEEDSFEVAQAIMTYPLHTFTHPAMSRHMDYLIDRAWLELSTKKQRQIA